MIARIKGKLTTRGEDHILLDTGQFVYKVFLPQTVMQRLDTMLQDSGHIELVTYHYFSHADSSRSVPVLIGFSNDLEREFFEEFITVSGIGPRGALKAINQPISLIARAIDEGDVKFLRSLPGIGEQKAKQIVAKLQNKVGRFALIQDKEASPARLTKDIEEEALAVLLQLQYKKQEALAMIKQAMTGAPQITTTEELLNEVYKQRKKANP